MSSASGSDYLHPEGKARDRIDAMLRAAEWEVQNLKDMNLSAGVGVAIREFPTDAGPADYGLFVDRQLVGIIEAKKEGTTLSGVEPQTLKYQASVKEDLPSFRVDGHLPFGYESTGTETWFTCAIDPEPTARRVFWFHRPQTLADQINDHARQPGHGTLRARIAKMPKLNADPDWLWQAQETAIRNLETSLKDNHQRALIQMSMGSGKTFCAANISERLIDLAGAQRILFLVDRTNLGTQTLQEFQGFDVPGAGRKFSELYNVQHLTQNALDQTSSVCIATIQRVYAMLRGEPELAEDLEDTSNFELPTTQPVEVDYNQALPIDAFDVIIVDECHRSIYGVWRQVLEYFDALLIGLTATPSKQTMGFFNQNLVMEYGHSAAVTDGVNVDFDVFRLSTSITESGSTVEAGYWMTFRDRETRAERQEIADADFTYQANELNQRVVAKDQIRTALTSIRDNLPSMFPDRQIDAGGRLEHIPKTLIFAQDDSHAEDIVRIARDVFGKGNKTIAKITYKASDGGRPEDLLKDFRNRYLPRIAVTVDMIATGTDVKPIEMVVFMRMVGSQNYFQQMMGRGVRTISDEDLQEVTPDSHGKDRFVLVDAVGVTETKLIDTTPLERKRGVALQKLLQQAALGQVSDDLVSTLASRIARMQKRVTPAAKTQLEDIAGQSLSSIEHRLIDAIDPDKQVAHAQLQTGKDKPSEDELAAAKRDLLTAAVEPFATNPTLRQELVDAQRTLEQAIDEVSVDSVTRAEFATDAKARAQNIIDSFREFLDQNKDEITALQVFYSKPYAQRLTYRDIKELAEAIERPPHRWTTAKLWEAYETLDASKVRGSADKLLTNIVSLVRYALGLDDHLAPFPEHVEQRFQGWLAQQQATGTEFSGEQLEWLGLIRNHLASSLTIELRDLQEVPFNRRGGMHKARELFGRHLNDLLDDLTEALAA